MSKPNIGKAWQPAELEAFFRAFINVGEDFREFARFEGLNERTMAMCKNLFSLHDQFLSNAVKNIEERDFDNALVDASCEKFIHAHQSLIDAANTITSPSPRLTRSTRSTQKQESTVPLASPTPAAAVATTTTTTTPATSASRKRKKPDTPTDYTSNTEARRSSRRTANRKLTYNSLNEEAMFNDVLRQNDDMDEDDMIIDDEPVITRPSSAQEDEDFAPGMEPSPAPRRRGRPPKSRSATPSTKKTPGTTTPRPKRGRPPKSASKTSTPKTSTSSTTKSHTTTTTRATASQQSAYANRRKSATPQRIPRKTKTELQHLPYILAPLPIDSLPPNTPNGSTIKRDNFARNSQLPLKLRKIGTHGTVPNAIKVQDLSGYNDEDTQNKIQTRAEQFGKLLASNGRRFCACEWFYPTIDCGYFIKNEFMEELRKLNLNHVEKMTRAEWNVVRSVMGTPRRLSNNFLESERNKLNVYRECVRKFYHEADAEKPHLYIYPQQLKVNEEVLILNPQTNYVHHAKILGVIGNDSYHVQVLDVQKPFEITVPDTHVMQTGPIHVNVSKKSFDAISASPNMLFSPGGNMRTQAHFTSREKLVAMNGGGDASVGETTAQGAHPQQQSQLHVPAVSAGGFASPGRTMISPLKSHASTSGAAQHTPQNGTTAGDEDSPGTPIVGVNLFSQQSSAVPQLNLPPNLAANVDFKSMAETILKLKKKKSLLNEINDTIKYAEEHAEQHPDEQSARTEIDYKIANLVVQLQEVDAQLQFSLDSLPIVTPEEPSTSESTQNGRRRGPKRKSDKKQPQPKTDTQKRTHNLFEDNREKASQIVNRLIVALDMSNVSYLNEPDTKNSNSIRQLISDCVAFLLHLETCVQDRQFTSADAELTLTAGLLALKPKGEPNQELEAIYDEITRLIIEVQEFILRGVNSAVQ
eukprot:CAMPEP_0117441858 /NCGR_PEP_ID=MMETSP0759-20121206/3850_1 /TAXON_ID=63605 /ORGANISM="Percolomonas cosmopolitus, Strain WS" /LENGTH=923 /DNA_ID=CAMNT_0005233723 /DNA_START=401 /DNA_END=3172 /DNA_ORIENTATION=+